MRALLVNPSYPPDMAPAAGYPAFEVVDGVRVSRVAGAGGGVVGDGYVSRGPGGAQGDPVGGASVPGAAWRGQLGRSALVLGGRAREKVSSAAPGARVEAVTLRDPFEGAQSAAAVWEWRELWGVTGAAGWGHPRAHAEQRLRP